MKNLLKYSLLGLALSLTASATAHADDRDHHKDPPKCNTAPEVDPSMAIGGLALLAGTLTVARAKRAAR